MKVLVIVHGFPPTAQGGAEIYAHTHAVALRRLFGDDILVFTRDQDPRRDDYDVRVEKRDGLQIVRVNNTFRTIRTFEETYRNDTIGAIANRVIDEFSPDVAHIHHLTCLSTTIVRSLAVRRIPCILTLHDYWLLCHRGQLLDVNCRLCDGPGLTEAHGPPVCAACLGPAGSAGPPGFIGAAAVRAIERHLPEGPSRQLRRVAGQLGMLVYGGRFAEDRARARVEHMRDVCADVTHFLAPSRHMRDRFVTAGIAPSRITVAGYGFDHARFAAISRETRDEPGRLRLGFLGSLMVSKAPHVLLEAIRRLPPGAVSVDIYGAPTPYHGDDSYRTQLEPLLTQEGVRLHGAIAHDRVAGALASLDALVVPSIWPENSPLVIQEAFLSGRPVIASRIGGIPEVVSNGTNGLLFRPGDANDLASAILRLLREPDLLPALRAGIPAVRTIEDDVRSTRQVYQAHRPVPAQSASAPSVAAVVLNFRTPDETLLAVKSLLASRRPLRDIIVVDNDTDGPAHVRHALKSLRPEVICVTTGRNLGFSGGMNVGIREALARGADRVLLANSDVIVPPDALELLERSLSAHRGAGIAGPVVLARSEPDRIASLGMSYRPSTGRMSHCGTGDRLQTRPMDRLVDGVSGCLMLIRREVFEAVGLLDEDYFFSFEDLEFCLRARRAGFATVLAGAATVYHQGGQSMGAASQRRLYFAARNHLLMATRAAPSTHRVRAFCRSLSIVVLNLAHAVRATGGSLAGRLQAVASGTRDYAAGRLGSDEPRDD